MANQVEEKTKPMRIPVSFTDEEEYLYTFAKNRRGVSGYIKDLIEADYRASNGLAAAPKVVYVPMEPQAAAEPPQGQQEAAATVIEQPEPDEEQVESINDILGGVQV